METSWVLMGLACFFDLNEVYLPTYVFFQVIPVPKKTWKISKDPIKKKQAAERFWTAVYVKWDEIKKQNKARIIMAK